jgi:hypothetical protein
LIGSAPADSGSGNSTGFIVNSSDETSARNDPHSVFNPAAITNVNDHDRDGQVNSSDQALARSLFTNFINQLKFLSIGAGGPFAPDAPSVPAASENSDAPGLASDPAAQAVAIALAAVAHPASGAAAPSVAVQPTTPGSGGEIPAVDAYFQRLAVLEEMADRDRGTDDEEPFGPLEDSPDSDGL